MADYVFLDAGPLQLACKGDHNPNARRCREWIRQMEALGYMVLVAEVSDYEVRRELMRSVSKRDMLDRLDELIADVLVPLDRRAMLKAAEFWALLSNRREPTADPKELDCDTILAAQAVTATQPEDRILIVTTNIGHLSRYPGIEVMPLDFLDRPR